ncbi:glycoside hydrolase family 78 protein [Bacteroides rodentium]
MKRNILILFAFLVCTAVQGQTSVCLTDLRSEHLDSPIGVDNPTPRLSWRMEDSRKGAVQTSWQIVVDEDSLNVVNGCGRMWNSGRNTSRNQLVTYAGKELRPFTKYYWKAICGDMEHKEIASPISCFEMGMMGMQHWQGAWIGDGKDIHHEPALYFRKKFEAGKEIKSARAYIAAAGLYELYINGEKIGNHRLDPLYTRFDRRNLYVVYDVTSQLRNGDNAIGVLLGNGWYNHQSKAVWDFDRAPWRNRPAFCLDLRITYADGSVETIPTDLSWRTSSGAITFNSIYTGEHYDARLEQKGWSTPEFDDSKWHGVGYRSVPSSNVTAQQARPIRNVETFPAVSFRKVDGKTYVYDFGQNMAGVTRICLSGERGTEVRIKHGERLDPDGRLDLSNIDVYFRGDKEKDPFQTDILILSGEDDEFMPRFNYKGFRYVEVVADKPIELGQNSLTAYFMHSDVPAAGSLEASTPLIDKLLHAANHSYLSNLMGYPTDCPQREKNGWTGDGHFAIEAALYNFDGITVYEKWLADHRDEQQPNGVLPDIIPTGGWGYGTDNGLDWTSTIAIIPWNLYLFYGDSKPLADCYENIKRYVDYVERTSNNHLTTWGRGDWVPVKSHSNKELTSSVYFYVDTKILAATAKLFGKQADYEYYDALAEKIKQAVNGKFLNRETGVYAGGSQTEQSVPLQWKIVPEELIGKVAANLARKVEESDFHLDVGVLGAKAILNALSENGYAETAYRVAVQDTYPSWGWWVVNGATTLLENWDLQATRDISDNHMMFGEIGAWFYKGLGGIFPDPAQPGFRNILLRPHFMKGLKQFEARHQSPYGEIISRWEWKGKRVRYEVTVPANSTATLTLPDEAKGEQVVELTAGRHEFIVK